jgi:hypothetical protein
VITKKKPQGLAGAFRELMTDADTYTIEFNSETLGKLSPAQKLTVLSAQLLADYMYFDGNTEKCQSDDSGVTCYFWYCSLIGAIIPCCIKIPKQ